MARRVRQRPAPPLAETFNPIGGQRMYDVGNIPNLIVNRYGRLNYHVYPAPNYDSAGGRVVNNSWREMPGWLQNRLDGVGYPRLASIITEFGWNPGQIDRCRVAPGVGANPDQGGNPGFTQNIGWRTNGQRRLHDQRGGDCFTMDGQIHYFWDAVYKFLQTEKANAEVVAAWLVRGDERADGINDNGALPWLQNYQQSSPGCIRGCGWP